MLYVTKCYKLLLVIYMKVTAKGFIKDGICFTSLFQHLIDQNPRVSFNDGSISYLCSKCKKL